MAVMRAFIKLVILIAVLLAIDFLVLDSRYRKRVWSEAQRHGGAVATELSRWVPKGKQ